MKRVVKQLNKKGFTLVETLLATFILVVISTMLVNGFIATRINVARRVSTRVKP